MKKIALFLVVCLVSLSLVACCSTAEDKDTVTPADADSMINPMVETTQDALLKAVGFNFTVPEKAENVKFFLIGNKLAEMQFTFDGMDYVARMQSADKFTDISGMYIEWAQEQDTTIDRCEGKLMRGTDGGKTIDVCNFYDVVPGIMYSVSTISENDLDGFDIEAIAKRIYTPLQGEVE